MTARQQVSCFPATVMSTHRDNDERYDGARFNGSNLMPWERSLRNSMRSKGLLGHLDQTESAPPDPFKDPLSYALEDPDFMKEPSLGKAKWREAAIIRGRQAAPEEGGASPTPTAPTTTTPSPPPPAPTGWHDFSTEPEDTWAGKATRLSTTNSADAVRSALTTWKAALDKFELAADRCTALILKSIDQKVFDKFGIVDGDSAPAVFQRCSDYFTTYVKMYRNILISQFLDLKRDKGESVESFYLRVFDLARTVARIGQDYGNEAEQLRIFLRGFADVYPALISLLRNMENLTMEKALLMLRTEELQGTSGKQHSEKEQKSDRTPSQALWTSTPPEKEPKPSPKKPAASRASPDVECFNCGGRGHYSKECPTPRADRGGNEGSRSDGQGQRGRRGQRGGRTEQKVRFAEERDVALVAMAPLLASDRKGTVGVALTALNVNSQDEEVWILDSGASCHMTSLRSRFSTYSELPAGRNIITANGAEIPIAGTGTVTFRARGRDGKEIPVTLKDCLHVPDLTENLISIPAIVSKGLSVSFKAGECRVLDSEGKTYLCADQELGHYCLRATIESTWDFARTAAVPPSKEADAQTQFMLWHARLGHPSERVMHEMAAKGLVSGIDMSRWSKLRLGFCEACTVAKQKRLPFDSSKSRETVPLGRVHMDLAGPFTESFSRFKYYYVLIDEATNKLWLRFLHKKSDAFMEFKGWKVEVESQSSYKVKCLRTDNGGEFTSNAFEEYLKRHGIRHEVTNPDTPEQNGKAERANLTIMDHVRAMLHQAGLSRRFWAEAARHAAWLINRTPTRALKNKAPEEAWSGKRPDVDNVPIFGANAWALVKITGRKKLADRSRKLIFVGIPDNVKGYRLVTPGGTMSTSRNVKFDESPISSLNPASSSASDRAPKALTHPIVTEDDEVPDLEEIDSDDDDDEDDLGPGGLVEPRLTRHALDNDHKDDDDGKVPPLEDIEENSDSDDSDDEFDDAPGEIVEQQPRSPPRQAAPPGEGLRRTQRQQQPRLNPNATVQEEYWARHRQSLAQRDPTVGFALAASITDEDNPLYRTALLGPEKEDWREAILDELLGVIDNGTFVVADLPASRKAITAKWVLKKKRQSDGSLERFKARLVARGFTQVEGFDYDEVFAPVTRFATVRFLAALSCRPNVVTAHTDVKLAYLNGDLREEIYMEAPDGFIEYLEALLARKDLAPDSRARVDLILSNAKAAMNLGKRVVLRLLRPLYGLKQAGNEWNRKLDTVLKDLGFVNFPSDVCVYSKRAGHSYILLAIYVDDMYWVSNDRALLDSTKKDFAKKFTVTDFGEPEWFLGMRHRRAPGLVTLDQAAYTAKLLEKFNMTDSRPVGSPADPSTRLTVAMSPKTDSERADMAVVPYREAVGSLMYLAVGTRPDISAAVGIAARYMANPGRQHWQAVKRIFRYLKGTPNIGIIFMDPNSDSIVGYSDSDWAQDLDDRRSTSGYVFKVFGGPISWQSAKLKTPALSTAEAEYMALTEASKEAIWWRQLTDSLGFTQQGPTTIFTDSQSAMALVRAPTVRPSTKHIDIRAHFIRNVVADGQVNLCFLPTKEMTADILTKALNAAKTEQAREMLGMAMIED